MAWFHSPSRSILFRTRRTVLALELLEDRRVLSSIGVSGWQAQAVSPADGKADFQEGRTWFDVAPHQENQTGAGEQGRHEDNSQAVPVQGGGSPSPSTSPSKIGETTEHEHNDGGQAAPVNNSSSSTTTPFAGGHEETADSTRSASVPDGERSSSASSSPEHDREHEDSAQAAPVNNDDGSSSTTNHFVEDHRETEDSTPAANVSPGEQSSSTASSPEHNQAHGSNGTGQTAPANDGGVSSSTNSLPPPNHGTEDPPQAAGPPSTAAASESAQAQPQPTGNAQPVHLSGAGDSSPKTGPVDSSSTGAAAAATTHPSVPAASEAEHQTPVSAHVSQASAAPSSETKVNAGEENPARNGLTAPAQADVGNNHLTLAGTLPLKGADGTKANANSDNPVPGSGAGGFNNVNHPEGAGFRLDAGQAAPMASAVPRENDARAKPPLELKSSPEPMSEDPAEAAETGPEVAGLISDTTSFDVSALSAALGQFLENLETGASQMLQAPFEFGWTPWLVAAALSAAGLELSRQQFKRPGLELCLLTNERSSGIRFRKKG